MDLPSTLIFDRAFIDGQWVDSDTRASFAIIDPATAEVIAHVPNMGAVETARAITAAQTALPAWSSMTAKARADIMRRWFKLILAHQEQLAAIITRECGKPLSEARSEVVNGAAFVEWFGEEAKRLYGEVIPAPDNTSRIFTLRQAIGVSAAIT
ncbi:MAG: aldehyde dehydrogenase family protein, partial [Magnetovibrio sp.]|nr:aldehyde dehydrogenase family protein [Magnetovibrio sp.]